MLIVGLWLGFAFSVRHRGCSLCKLCLTAGRDAQEGFLCACRGASRDDAMGESP